MPFNTRSIIINSLVYFAGILVIFLVYLGLRSGFSYMQLIGTVQRVLYVSPAIIPSPLTVLFIILPVVTWRLWDRGEPQKAFFYASLLVLAFYLILTKTWLTLSLIAWFLIGYLIAAALEYAFEGRAPVWLLSGTAYLVVGPIVYWLIVIYA